ncbi:MAG TPA: hypothetical protein VKB37_06325, partial [Jatrophihabitantaceae bacterium]|nr:hypothetical protein [Jatrophihabitantaceae bacterium]
MRELVGEGVCEPVLLRVSSLDRGDDDGDGDGDDDGDRGATDPSSSWVLLGGAASGGAMGSLAGGAPRRSTPTGLLCGRGCIVRSGVDVRGARVGSGAPGRGWWSPTRKGVKSFTMSATGPGSRSAAAATPVALVAPSTTAATAA